MTLKTSDIAVLTLPTTPPSREKQGLLTLMLFNAILAERMGADSYICMNNMHSLKEVADNVSSFSADLKNIGLNNFTLWDDRENKAGVAKNMEKLLESGHISSGTGQILACECGQIEQNTLAVSEHFSKNYSAKTNQISCNSCRTECVKKEVPCLFFHVPEDEAPIFSSSSYMPLDAHGIHEDFKGKDLIVSKQRETGYPLTLGDKKFNIDVDFVNFQYLSTIKQKNKVVVASAHSTFSMYMVNLVNGLVDPESNVFFAPMSYIKGASGLDLKNENISVVQKQLALAASINTKKKESSFRDGMATFVQNKLPKHVAFLHEQYFEFQPQSENQDFLGYAADVVNDIKYENFLKRAKDISANKRISP